MTKTEIQAENCVLLFGTFEFWIFIIVSVFGFPYSDLYSHLGRGIALS
jgi:hypothetical protein